MCEASDCDRDVLAKGLCSMHYARKRRTGSTQTSVTPAGAAAEFFYANVNTDTDLCIDWLFGGNQYGYGEFSESGVRKAPHVEACILANGPRPDGAEARHLCGRPTCFNPRHLTWGTSAENKADAVAAGTFARGERHGKAKLTEADVRAIRVRRANGETTKALGAEFGVSHATVCDITSGRTWSHLA